MAGAADVSLAYWGVFALWPAYWASLLIEGVVTGLGLGGWRLLKWRARLAHSPPAMRADLGRVVRAVAPPLVAAALVVGVLVAAGPALPVLITAVAGFGAVMTLWALHRLLTGPVWAARVRLAGAGVVAERAAGPAARTWRRIGAVVVLAAFVVLVSGGSAAAAPVLAGGAVTALAGPEVLGWLGAAVLTLGWLIAHRLRGQEWSPRADGWRSLFPAMMRVSTEHVVALAMFGGLLVLGWLGVYATAEWATPLRVVGAAVGGLGTVTVAATARALQTALRYYKHNTTVRTPVGITLAAAGTAVLTGVAVTVAFGPAVVPVTAVLVAVAVTEGVLRIVRHQVIDGKYVRPAAAVEDGAPVAERGPDAEVPAVVAGTVLEQQWPRITAARAARRTLAVLLVGTAVVFALLSYQVFQHLLADAPQLPAVDRDDMTARLRAVYGQLLSASFAVPLVATAVNAVRTIVGTLWPSLIALAAERVASARLLARLSVGIGVATVGLGGLFTATVVLLAEVFTAFPIVTVVSGAVVLLANTIAALLYRAARTEMGRALSRHAFGGAVVGVGTVVVGALAMAGLPGAALAGAGFGLLTVVVGLATVTGVRVDVRHPVAGLVRLTRAVPGLPVVFARRLLELPEVLAEVRTLIWAYVRFARTRGARIPATDDDLQSFGGLADGGRYVIRDGYVIDTYRVWFDWNDGLRELSTQSELVLLDSQRWSAHQAWRAGLSRGEIRRLIGVDRLNLRRWLAEFGVGDKARQASRSRDEAGEIGFGTAVGGLGALGGAAVLFGGFAVAGPVGVVAVAVGIAAALWLWRVISRRGPPDARVLDSGLLTAPWWSADAHPHGLLTTLDLARLDPVVAEHLGAVLEELYAEGKGWVHGVLPPDAGTLGEGQVLFLVLPGVVAGRLARRAGLTVLEAEEVAAGLLGYGFTAPTGAGVIASTTVAWLDAGTRGVRHLVVEHGQREIRGEFEGRPDEHEQDRRRIVDAFRAGRHDDADPDAAFWLDESYREDFEEQLRRRYQVEVLRGIVHQLRAEPEARTDPITHSFLAAAELHLVRHLIAVGRGEDARRESTAISDYLESALFDGYRAAADRDRDEFLRRASGWVEDVIWHVVGTPDPDHLTGLRDAGGRIDEAVRRGLDAGASRARVLGVIAAALNLELRRTAYTWRDHPDFDASRIAVPLSTQARAWLVAGSAPATGPMPPWLWEHAVAVLRELAAAEPDEYTAPWRPEVLRVVGAALRRPLPVDEVRVILGLPHGALSQDELVLAVLRATSPGVRWKLRWAELAGASPRGLIDLVAVWTDPTMWRYRDLLDEVFGRLPVDEGAVDAMLAFRAVPSESPVAAWLELVGGVARLEPALRAFDLTGNAQERLAALADEVGDLEPGLARAALDRAIDDLHGLFRTSALRGRAVADLDGLFAHWPTDPVLAAMLTEYVQVIGRTGDTTAASDAALWRHRLDPIPGSRPVERGAAPEESIVPVGEGLVRVGVIEDLSVKLGRLRDEHGHLPEDAAALSARDWIGAWRWEPGGPDELLAYVVVERPGERIPPSEVQWLTGETPELRRVFEELHRPDGGDELHAGLLPLLLLGPAVGLFGAAPAGVPTVVAALAVAVVAARWRGDTRVAAGGRSTRAPPSATAVRHGWHRWAVRVGLGVAVAIVFVVAGGGPAAAVAMGGAAAGGVAWLATALGVVLGVAAGVAVLVAAFAVMANVWRRVAGAAASVVGRLAATVRAAVGPGGRGAAVGSAWDRAREWVLVAVIGIGLGIPWIVLGFVAPLPSVAPFVMFVMWGTFDLFEGNGWSSTKWSERLLTTGVTLIWAVDLGIDVGTILAAVGFGTWVGGAFILADLAFLIATWPTAWNALRGREVPEAPGEWVQRWVAFPAVTTATGLHTLELAGTAPWAAMLMGLAATAFAVQTVIKHLQARRKDAGTRVERIALRVDGRALIGYGLMRMAMANLWLLAGATIGVALALRWLLWILNRRGPPGGRELPADGPDDPDGGTDRAVRPVRPLVSRLGRAAARRLVALELAVPLLAGLASPAQAPTAPATISAGSTSTDADSDASYTGVRLGRAVPADARVTRLQRRRAGAAAVGGHAGPGAERRCMGSRAWSGRQIAGCVGSRRSVAGGGRFWSGGRRRGAAGVDRPGAGCGRCAAGAARNGIADRAPRPATRPRRRQP